MFMKFGVVMFKSIRHFCAALLTSLGMSALVSSAIAAPIEAPAGTYVLEKTHASLHWRIRHMGLSNYTARFKRFDATIEFDPVNLSRSTVQATIDVASLETDLITPDGRDFNAELRSEPFFNTAKFSQATFKSTQVQAVGNNVLRVQGELTLLGVTRPVTLQVTINGSMKSHPFAKVPALGISATGSVVRTAFSLNPPPIREGVGDQVDLAIEAEFLKKP
jgi:polyisoprenoid-binding protein YceI